MFAITSQSTLVMSEMRKSLYFHLIGTNVLHVIADRGNRFTACAVVRIFSAEILHSCLLGLVKEMCLYIMLDLKLDYCISLN